MQSEQPVTVYFRWQEQDLHYLSPLIRLLWGTLIHELTTIYDTAEGKNCHPVCAVRRCEISLSQTGETREVFLSYQLTR